MKHWLGLFFALICLHLVAQTPYDVALKKGQDAYNRAEYSNAAQYWTTAKGFEGANIKKLNNLIWKTRDDDRDGFVNGRDKCPNDYAASNEGCPLSRTPSTELPPADGFVLVKSGTFTMGCKSGRDTDCQSNEMEHTVTVSDFYISKYELTQAEWRKVMGGDPRKLAFPCCDQCPVDGVSWDEITDFLQKLNSTRTGGLKPYRLPTEAEWEFAARGGNQSKGFTFAGSSNLDEVAWHYGNSAFKTHPVGKLKANELGLFDMSGNVWEWCSDWYTSRYYASSKNAIDPKGPAAGSSRVLRGGSWGLQAVFCHAAYRRIAHEIPRSTLGFRLARSR